MNEGRDQSPCRCEDHEIAAEHSRARGFAPFARDPQRGLPMPRPAFRLARSRWLLPFAAGLALRSPIASPPSLRDVFDLIAVPNGRILDDLQAGDLIVRATPSEPEVMLALGQQAQLGSDGSIGVRAVDPTADAEAQPELVHVRAITGAHGHVLADRIVLRPRVAAESFNGHSAEPESASNARVVDANRRYSASLGWSKADPALQRLLGIGPQTASDDDDFTSAVSRWQTRMGLEPDGIIGPRTWQHMRDVLGAASAAARFTAQLPRSGPGFYAYVGMGRQFGRAGTIRAIETIAARWHRGHPNGPRLGIGDISLDTGAEFPPHKSHRNGLDVDVRPVRGDRLEQPVRWYRESCNSRQCDEGIDPACLVAEYSPQMTQELIELISNNGVLPVQFVLFNDCRLRGRRYAVGHDNHLHVRFTAPADAEISDHPDESDVDSSIASAFGGAGFTSSNSVQMRARRLRALVPSGSGTKVHSPAAGQTVVTGSILFADFDVDRWNLKAEFYAPLDHLATLFNLGTDVQLYIEGHASQTGPETRNQTLSQRRADEIFDQLVGVLGVDKSKVVDVLGVGSLYPIRDNRGFEDALNRSVRIAYSAKLPVVVKTTPPAARVTGSKKWRIHIALSGGGGHAGIGGAFVIGEIENMKTHVKKSGSFQGGGIGVGAQLPGGDPGWGDWTEFETDQEYDFADFDGALCRYTSVGAGVMLFGYAAAWISFPNLGANSIYVGGWNMGAVGADAGTNVGWWNVIGM